MLDACPRDPAAVERAEHAVQRWSKAIGRSHLTLKASKSQSGQVGVKPATSSEFASAGLVQRFSLGFRGPICLFAGFLGVKPLVFGAGVASGAFGTMALQITAVRPLEPWLLMHASLIRVIADVQIQLCITMVILYAGLLPAAHECILGSTCIGDRAECIRACGGTSAHSTGDVERLQR
jgi:hypothetical protein